MPEERDLEDDVRRELSVVRQKGLARLRVGEVATPFLDDACKKVPGYQSNLTRAAALKLLLQHEIELVAISQYRPWLETLFGLREAQDAMHPTELRRLAAKEAGETNYTTFIRSDDGLEKRGLRGLAEQIVADCLQADNHVMTEAAPSPEDGTAAPNAQKLKKLGTNKHRTIVLAVTVVVLVGAAITTVQVFRGSAPSAPADVQQRASLLATATSLSDISLGHSGVFPSDKVSGVKTFANRLNAAASGSGEDATTVFSDELKAGAYAMGGITAQVQLRNTSDDEVVVYNIRPVIRQRGDVVTGAAISYPSQGGGIHTIWFQLDRPNSIARDNDANGPPFFTTQRIGLTKTNAETLILQFKASAAAYDFNIAIDYEVNGQKFSQIVKQDKGGPDLLLRASGSLCDQSPNASKGLAVPGVVQRGYQQVFRLGSYTDLSSYRVLPVEPSAFIANSCH